ncbi:MAG TPA: hypothetical protein VFZ25_13480 [Chloroflexota bacterium]|nr:hypothetical protein [Chloroflexota bacterium]
MGKKSAVIYSASTQRTSGASLGQIKLAVPVACSALRARTPSVLLGLRAVWRATKLLSILYLTYSCMHLSPPGRLRSWGESTWWRLAQEKPEDLWEDDLPSEPPVTMTRVHLARTGPSAFPADPTPPTTEEPRAA